LAAADESDLRVFVVARSAAARRRIRAVVERAGGVVAGEAASIEELPPADAGDATIVDDGAGPRAETLLEALTPRERQVLERLADGYANREIAAQLGISEHTVKFHVAALYGKLGVASRAEAVRIGLRHGLITL
jgi:DNA-binding CsgD family transcriptional regulator